MIYYRENLRAIPIETKATGENKHRITTAKIGNMIFTEAYAPVSSALEVERENFFAILIALIQDAQAKHPNCTTVVAGDLNAHIAGWYAGRTDSSGRMVE